MAALGGWGSSGYGGLYMSWCRLAPAMLCPTKEDDPLPLSRWWHLIECDDEVTQGLVNISCGPIYPTYIVSPTE